jgi:small ligand-binding sensory domain FIST
VAIKSLNTGEGYVLRAGVGLSTERDSAGAAAAAARAALQSGDLERADLLLVFATTPHGPGFTRVTRTASEVCGTKDVVGCSAAGVIAGDQEIESGAGVAVLALAGDLAPRRFFVPLCRGNGERAADEIAEAVGDAAQPGAVLLVFADSYNLEAEPLFERLGRRLPGVRVIGGGASEDGSTGQVSVFAGDAASSGAISGVLVRGSVAATVGVAQAVRPVSAVHTVTQVDDNWILGLDGHPAYSAFAAVVPAPLLEDPRRALGVVLAGLPTAAEDSFVARHLVGLDRERGIALAARVREGDQLFFGVRDRYGARDELQRMLARQIDAWRTGNMAGGLYVNCVGRGRGLYGVSGLDTAYIRQHLGPVPVAGFFSGAEFAPSGGVSRLHQYTGVLTMLGTAG